MDKTLNIALPKGRLGNQVYELFARVGFGTDAFADQNRKLVIESEDGAFRYFLVKPSDVAIYVERGVADIGVVGKDSLLEGGNDVYELLDLNLGRCRVAVAGPNDYRDDRSRTLQVATKYVNIAKGYYASQNREIEIIKLSGSIELAPLLGLSDVIVDIVETGTTLKENNMRVLTEIMPISARLVANKSSYKFKGAAIDSLREKLEAILQEAGQ
ncbi:MAG: ATP phosphoribosyltransferase [Oscillospiraceae bacterium]